MIESSLRAAGLSDDESRQTLLFQQHLEQLKEGTDLHLAAVYLLGLTPRPLELKLDDHEQMNKLHLGGGADRSGCFCSGCKR